MTLAAATEAMQRAATGGPGRPEPALAGTRLADAKKGAGLALAALAEVLAELGGVDDAMELVETAVATRLPEVEARALRTKAKLERRLRHHQAALATTETALALADVANQTSERARILRERAVVLAGMRRRAQGLTTIDEALSLNLPDDVASRMRASLLWAKAIVLMDASRSDSPGKPADLEKADEVLRDARMSATSHQQRLWIAWLDLLYARLLRTVGEYDAGQTVAFRALELFGQMRHRYGTARCRLEVGRSLIEVGSPRDALIHLGEARSTLAVCGDSWLIADAARTLGEASLRCGLVDQARREFLFASRRFGELRDLERVNQIRELLLQIDIGHVDPQLGVGVDFIGPTPQPAGTGT